MQYRAPAHWLLDLEVHGRVFRYGSSPVEVSTAAGDTLAYVSGLGDLELPLVGDGTIGRSIPLTLDDETDWPLLESRGQSPHRSSGVLRWWREGQTIEEARVVLRGVALVSRVGLAGEGIDLTLTREPRAAPTTRPPPSAAVTSDTWPVNVGFTIDDAIYGQHYQLVIGEPGNSTDDAYFGQPTAVVPVLMAENSVSAAASKVIMGMGPMVAGTTVWLREGDGTIGGTGSPPSTMEDLLGRTVTYTESTTLGVEKGKAYYVGYGGATYGGGLKSPYSTGVLRRAGEVIRWALAQSGREADQAKQSAYGAHLDVYKVDTWINKPIDILSWLESAVLSWLPVIAVEGERGLYFRPLIYTYTPEQAVAHLVESSGVERVGGLIRMDDEPANEVTVRFRKGVDGGYLKQITLTAQSGVLSGDEAGVSGDARVYASAAAKRSQTYYGRTFSKTITLDHTWDNATAIRVAEQTLARQAMPRRVVTYEGGSELDALEPGDPIIVTDAGLYLTEVPALVGEITLSTEAATVTLILLDERPI